MKIELDWDEDLEAWTATLSIDGSIVTDADGPTARAALDELHELCLQSACVVRAGEGRSSR